MLGDIILFPDQELPDSICLQTSKKTDIKNEQFRRLPEHEINYAKAIENKFEAFFQGEAIPIYNCHGLTFASRRTGIYKEGEIQRILHDEYQEIRAIRNILVGDIVIYYLEDIPIHSGIIVEAKNKDPNNIATFKALSKVLRCHEIVHDIYKSPYGSNLKFYRIQHEFRIFR